MDKEYILKAEKESQEIMRKYGSDNWADGNCHESPESILLMVILKKVLDIESKLRR